jgi:hypothetical protein
MLKKIMLLALAVGALVAFAAPATAGAHELTNEAEETLATGTTITGVSHNTTMTLPENRDIVCETVTIHGIVEVNNGSTVKVVDDPEGADTAETCHLLVTNPPGTVVATIPLTFTPTFEELHLSTGEGATNTVRFSFLMHIPLSGGGTFTCQEESGASTVTLTTGTNVIHASSVIRSESPGCFQESEMHGSFALTSGAEQVIVD